MPNKWNKLSKNLNNTKKDNNKDRSIIKNSKHIYVKYKKSIGSLMDNITHQETRKLPKDHLEKQPHQINTPEAVPS